MRRGTETRRDQERIDGVLERRARQADDRQPTEIEARKEGQLSVVKSS